MEDKPAGSSPSVGAGAVSSPVSAEPASSRRRAGGQKRKASALLSSSGSSSAPSKRLTREKASASAGAISHGPIHNGPLTRASRLTPFSAIPTTAEKDMLEEKTAAAPDVTARSDEERSKLEAAMEADFEKIRSRDSGAHIVPFHCGWFSWTKVHPLEERALPSFFNGKSQTRTPDAYMVIRNWITKKFHKNPNMQVELKDLSELDIADMDARQEVFEFLDYWGLINFHPLLEHDPIEDADVDETAKTDSLLEKLFRFEAIEPCQQAIPKPNLTTPAVPSGLFPETAFAEEMARLEGPAVEYHCNSCSADCSRKRYHCQKQADYDLCADCFNNGKFGSNMSSSDFILMEPGDAPGLSGGKWTDQETLLLLEALELYKENWNEIAEHVATKTKAQCILHFVQMPIEDAFFNMDDHVDGNPKEIANPDATKDSASASKDVPETNEDKNHAEENQPQASPTEASKPEESSELKISKESGKPEHAREDIGQETSKPEVTSEVKAGPEIGENFALKALTEAFETIGYHPTPEKRLSFAEVGNPVMALAVFLARLIGADVATAAAHSSMKSLSSKSPGINLAARHCFLLEDPPDTGTKQAFDCTTAGTTETTSTNNNYEVENQKEGKSATLDDKRSLNNQADKQNEDPAPGEKKPLDSSNDKSTEKVNTVNNEGQVTYKESEPSKLSDCSNSELSKDAEKESDDRASQLDCLPTSGKDSKEGSSVEEQSELPEPTKDVDMVSDSNNSEKREPCQSDVKLPAEEPSEVAEESKDVDMVPDSLAPNKNEPEQPMNCPQPAETPKDIDVSSSLPPLVQEPQQPITPNSLVEHEAATANFPKENIEVKPECEVIKDDNNIDKVKRAAVSTLSAAAVKAKHLADQEEGEIRQLTASLIEKQLNKLETKLAFFNEMDGVILRVKEQLERSRQKLYHERAQIIAARLGLPATSSRVMPPSLPTNRIAMNFANSVARPPLGMVSQRPPISRPISTLAPPNSSNPFAPTTSAGNYIGPPGQDKLSSVGSK